LDVNALIALFDTAHTHHHAAHEWYMRRQRAGWRTCPITENGLLRILSHPAYPNDPLPTTEIARRLENFKKASPHYVFWPDDFSTSQWLNLHAFSISSAHLTDAYLLKLAAGRAGTLATFDLRIAPGLIGEKDSTLVEHIPV
jgi:toxin-antitoxin system PIN domain toxin